MSDITILIVVSLAIFSFIMIFQVLTLIKINLYEQKVLMLITRVSISEAERIINMYLLNNNH
jgi:hypothetical protein